MKLVQMNDIFPKPIKNLPEVDISLNGVRAYLIQGENEQIIFMDFFEDVHIPEHSHKSQWEIVLEGKVNLITGGKLQTYKKGDRFYIPEGVKHSADVFKGYCSIALT